MNTRNLNILKNMLTTLRAEAPELPIQQLQIFVAVALNEGTTARALERPTGMTQASIGRNVNALCRYAGGGREGLGWLETRVDPRDLRAKPLYLTDKGREVLDKVMTCMEG